MNNNLTYTRCGDYYIPNVCLSKENRPIDRWGRLHREYLKEHRPVRYQTLILSGKLWTYLADLNEQAEARLALITRQMAAFQHVDEELKGKDQMAWVCTMNSIRSRAEEIILREMIYEEDAQ